MAVDTEFEQAGREHQSRNALAQTIVGLRKKHRLSQQQLANRIGVHENTIVRLEKYPDRASLGLLEDVCSAMNASLSRVIKHAEKQQHMVASEKSSSTQAA